MGVTNYLVVALDDEIASFCNEHNVPVYRRDATISKSQAGTGSNHAISGLHLNTCISSSLRNLGLCILMLSFTF